MPQGDGLNPANDPEFRSFTELLLPILSPSEVRFVTEMYQLAERCHAGQLRHEVDAQGNRKPFFTHPLTVARYLIERLGCRDAWLIAVALLHDVLEDTAFTAEELEMHAGTRVCRDVVLLTQPAGESKAAYARRLLTFADGDILMVKTCDVLHNAETLRCCAASMQSKFIRDAADHYDPLLDRAIELAPARYRSRVAAIVADVHKLILAQPASDHVAA